MKLRLILISDQRRLPDWRRAIAALPKGAVVIFRDYENADRLALGRDMRRHCARHRVLFLVAGDPGLAHRLKADGVHLPEYQLGPRYSLPVSWLVTAAAHDGKALGRAALAGVDLVLLSPVFPTESHPGVPALGLYQFRQLARQTRVPIAALGGMTAVNARRLKNSGAVALAAIGGFRI